MASDKAARDDAVYNVAFEMFVVSNNRRPDADEVEALALTFGTKLDAIPTEQLGPMLDRATIDAAPYAPKVGNIIAAWQRERVNATRPTYQQIEQARKATKAPPSSDSQTDSDRFAVSSKIHMQRLAEGKAPIHCNCIFYFRGVNNQPFINRKGDTPSMRSLAVLSHDKTRWECAGMPPADGLIPTGPCDFVMAEKKARTWGQIKREQAQDKPAEAATEEADAYAHFRGLVEAHAGEFVAGLSDLQTPEEAEAMPLVEEKPRVLTLEMFALRFGWDLLVMKEEELNGVRRFFEWCQSQDPQVSPTRKNVEDVWAQWQFETGQEAA